MAKYDLISHIDLKEALASQIINTNTTTQGVIIDTKGYESWTLFLHSGTITDGVYTPLIEHGDDAALSDAAAVADADLLPSGTGQEAAIAFVAADDNAIKKIGYTGVKRYIRLSVVSTDVTSGGTIGAKVVLGHPHVGAL